MQFLGSNEKQNLAGDTLDTLNHVSLKSFTADPTAIGPFGASVLSWRVTGPTPTTGMGFQVELSGQVVSKSGEQVVHPASTTTYRLTAKLNQLGKELGSVQVTVDTSRCQINSLFNPGVTIQSSLTAGIVNSGDIYFRDNSLPVVTFSPGRIRVQLQLGARINNFPDPDVDIDASFGLAVNGGVLEATSEQISVDIGFPLYQSWVWLIPGAMLALPIALDGAKEKAYKKIHNAIQGLVELLDFLATRPKGFHSQSVRVDDGNNVAGVIEILQCPDDLLRKFATISQVNASPLVE
jgi:hypothetical protein